MAPRDHDGRGAKGVLGEDSGATGARRERHQNDVVPALVTDSGRGCGQTHAGYGLVWSDLVGH
jgi:hypothetical protein